MKHMITPYHLYSAKNDDKEFYSNLKKCTNDVVREARVEHHTLIERYRKCNLKDVSYHEALLDNLILGVLFNAYACRSGNASILKKNVILSLYRMRKNRLLKKSADKLRGLIACKCLVTNKVSVTNPDMNSLNQLMLFLTSCCEFKEELTRISNLRAWLESMDPKEAVSHLNEICDFASWFSEKARSSLGHYTKNVDRFLQYHHENYRNEEDYFFTGRSETEYHLNMVGAELMNRDLHSGFQKAQQKILLLPTCMVSDNSCKAKIQKDGMKCRHCNSNCFISQTVRKMQKTGVKTVLISHSSGFSQWLKTYAGNKNIALIGVACVLNLLTGGFQMKRLGIPSQCIFLNHPCCAKHWKNGVPATINFKRLSEICNTSTQQNNHAMV